MKEFLYKSSFIRYYTALFNRNLYYRKRTYFLVYGVAAYVGVLVFSAWSSMLSMMLALGLFIAAGMTAAYRRAQPNLASLMPLTSRKKVFYQFMSPIFFVITVIVMMWLISTVFTLVFTLLFSIDRVSLDMFTVYWRLIKEGVENMGGYGFTLFLFFTVICYAAGMVFGFIDKKRYQLLFAGGFYLMLIVAFYLITLPCKQTAGTFFFNPPPFYKTTLAYLKYPWLAVVLAGLAAVGAVVASVWFVNKKIGKKGY